VAAELLRWSRTAGTVVIVGAYKPGLHGVDLLSVMFAEITIVGTRIYQRSDIEAAIHLVTTGVVDAHRFDQQSLSAERGGWRRGKFAPWRGPEDTDRARPSMIGATGSWVFTTCQRSRHQRLLISV
jgi:hypothetical protein